ncbi:DMT family transporter [Halocynthiibacter namhaensis]|uniref:DMT family transporter n=1 Tax=Halocynthiibacter namhaensis TaxID=1290553 RepID=UPI0005796D4F|nr:DMT family transporter [Halocynthiibacter namhaensis]
MTQTPQRPAILTAALWMSGSIVSFTLMAIAGRALASDMDTFELMLWRSVIGMIIVLSIGGAAGTLNQVNTRDFGKHMLRNIAHFIGQNLWFFALPLIPLAQVFALEFTVPVWVMILAALFLGEKMTQTRIMAVLLGFSGILLVARPDTATISPGFIAAAFAAIGFAVTTILTKQMTKGDSITKIMFWLVTLQTAFGLVTAGYDGQITLPSLNTAPWLILVGICGLLAHFCIARALAVAPAMIVSPIDFARLPIIVVVGIVLYNEPLQWTAILGALIIFAANYLNILSESRKMT